jgi:uncharacterized protein (DUF1330 family)
MTEEKIPMKTYVLVRYAVTDEAAYQRYRELAGKTHVPHGGTLVAKGVETDQLEGSSGLRNFVLLEFPTPAAVRDWYTSPDYLAAKEARDGAGEMTITLIEG